MNEPFSEDLPHAVPLSSESAFERKKNLLLRQLQDFPTIGKSEPQVRGMILSAPTPPN